MGYLLMERPELGRGAVLGSMGRRSRLGWLGDSCKQQSNGSMVCSGGTSAIDAVTPVAQVCSQIATGPRYLPGNYIWKPPDKDHNRMYQFQFHSGDYDQYSCVPGIADCNSSYNDMIAGPGGSWNQGRNPQNEQTCQTVNNSGTPVSTTSVTPVTTLPAGVTTIYPTAQSNWPSGYVSTPATTDTSNTAGLQANVSTKIPTWALVAGGVGAVILLPKLFK